MKLKNKLFLTILAVISFAIYLCLLILVVPNKIPLLFDFDETVTAISTKWILIIPALFPIIFSMLSIIFCKRKKLKFCFLTLFTLSLYENVIFLTYYCLASSLSIGSKCEIPLSIAIFLPISIIMLILSLKLKNAPYLSFPAIRFKSTRETEFIWKQTHIFARDVYFLMSFVLFLVSVIFSFFKLCLIELAIFAFAIIVCTIVIYCYSNSLYKKYIEMKTRRDGLQNAKQPPSDEQNK